MQGQSARGNKRLKMVPQHPLLTPPTARRLKPRSDHARQVRAALRFLRQIHPKPEQLQLDLEPPKAGTDG